MSKPEVEFVEIVSDADLKKKEKQATEAVKRFYPNSGPLKLYRTTDRQIGLHMQIAVAPAEGPRPVEVYRAVMQVLGEKRGCRAGIGKVWRHFGDYRDSELRALKFDSVEEYDRAIDLTYEDPDWRDVPNFTPDGKKLLVPVDSVELFRDKGLLFSDHRLSEEKHLKK